MKVNSLLDIHGRLREREFNPMPENTLHQLKKDQLVQN